MVTVNRLYPWQVSQWQQVMAQWQQDRLPHALLLTAPPGMGKSTFAMLLAETLLCENTNNTLSEVIQPCGRCKACQLLKTGNHPDLMIIQPLETGKQIQIDQIRGLIQFCGLTAHYNGYQVVVIKPAEAMNRHAANSLLKLLEEPPPNTLLLLVSHQPVALPVTVRSRCQRLDFSRLDKKVTEAWVRDKVGLQWDSRLLLNLTAEAPLAALALVENEGMVKRQMLFDSFIQLTANDSDPIKIASAWEKLDIVMTLQWMISWTMDLIRYATTHRTTCLINQDYQNALMQITTYCDLQSLFLLLDLEREAQRLIAGTSNVKPQGLLENIAMTWLESLKRKKTA